jgi:GAF domain-containing protein
LSSESQAYKQLLKEHTRLQAQHRLLQRLLHLFGAPEDFEMVFEGLMDATMELFNAHSGALYMFDADKEELYFATARGPKAQEVLDLDVTIKPGQGIAGNSFKNNEVIAVSDAHKDPRFAKQVSESVGYEVRSMLTTPIVCDGEPLGVLQVLNKRGESSFSQHEVQFARQLGLYAGGLLGLGLELQDLQQRVAERSAEAEEAER